MLIEEDDLPGWKTVDYSRFHRLNRWRGDQRIGKAEMARRGKMIATESGKSPLELVLEVARGERTMRMQQFNAVVAALPYCHARLSNVNVNARHSFDPARLSDAELAAIAAGGGEAADAPQVDPQQPAGVVH